MSVNVTFDGVVYPIPVQGDLRWGPTVTRYLVALGTYAMSPAGGSYPLTADLNLGSSFGLIAPYYKSSSANIASAGFLRLGNTDLIEWRNFANAGNNTLGVNSSDQLVYNGTSIQSSVSVSNPITLSGSTIGLAYDNSTLNLNGSNQLEVASGGITNGQISGTASIAYSKLSLSNSILNADINASAAIAYGKLNLGTSIVNGDISSSAAIAVTKLAVGTANQFIGTNAAATANEFKTILGTSNQLSVTDGVGTLTLSTPQDISSTSSPTFQNLTIGNHTTLGRLIFDNPVVVSPEIAIGIKAVGGAGVGHTSGIDEVAVGNHALENDTTGAENTAIGDHAGSGITSGNNNTILGSSAGANTNGNFNTFLGTSAGEDSFTGDGNIGVGVSPLQVLAGGRDNVAVGNQALFRLTTGYENIAMGTSAGAYTTDGTGNVFIGFNTYSDVTHTHVSSSIGIGFENVLNATSTIAIGNGITNTASNTCMIGTGHAGANSMRVLCDGLTVTDTIAMGANKITGLANGSSSDDAAAFGQIASAVASYLPLIGGTLTGNITFDSATHGIVGITSGSNAAAGHVGQVITASNTSGMALFSTTVWGDVTNVVLTAGNWMIIGQVSVPISGIVPTGEFDIGIGVTSGNNSAGSFITDFVYINISYADILAQGSFTKCVSISTTTTYYLKVRGFYSSGSATMYGSLQAIRIS